jgi:protein involved in polysaccharide export with SLBB domain
MKPHLLLLLFAFSVGLLNPTVYAQQTNQTPTNDDRLITITGAIRSPGKVELRRNRIALGVLIAFSGGPTEEARGTVELKHLDMTGSNLNTGNDAKPETYTFTQLQRTDGSSGPFVVPGDRVFLPAHDYIFVRDNVLRPSRYIMDTAVRASEAIKLAGGVSQDAVKVEIFRCSEPYVGILPRTISISLKDLYRKRSKDIFLGANDILTVRGPRPFIGNSAVLCAFNENRSSDLRVHVFY